MSTTVQLQNQIAASAFVVLLSVASLGAEDGTPRLNGNEFHVKQGQSTFDFEGHEGGKYHSRTPHVPSDKSGLTIGRGYDMKLRKVDEILMDLEQAGLSTDDARLYAGAAGLSGDKAKAYIESNQLPEITPEQQKALFELTYPDYVAEAKRLFKDFNRLPEAAQEAVVDMIYNVGDLAGKFPKFTEAVRKQDWEAAVKESNRVGVGDRRNRVTRELLEQAAKQKEIDGDWPRAAFPTEYYVSSYRKDVPEVGLLEGVYRRASDAQRMAARLRASKYVVKVEVEVDPGTTDAFPETAGPLVRAIKSKLGRLADNDLKLLKDIADAYNEKTSLPNAEKLGDLIDYFGSSSAHEAGWESPPEKADLEPIDWARKAANRGDLVVAYPENAATELPAVVLFPSKGLGWPAAMAAFVVDAGKGEKNAKVRPVTDFVDGPQLKKYRFRRFPTSSP
ncbi:MAG: pesticin C-terminus-like muramidase [Pirellulaceae bacterium]